MSTTAKEILDYLEKAEALFDDNHEIKLDKDFLGTKRLAFMSIVLFHQIKQLEKEVSLLKNQLKNEDTDRN